MNNQFNPLEIFKMAMNIEKAGEAFYQKCIETHAESKIKSIFKELKEDEEEHYQYFKELLEQFEEEDNIITKHYLYDEQVNNYLKALVNTKVFPTNETIADNIVKNLKEAIEIGIKAEKNSLLLYLELIQVEKDKKTIEALEKLIIEEKRHLVKLKMLKDSL